MNWCTDQQTHGCKQVAKQVSKWAVGEIDRPEWVDGWMDLSQFLMETMGGLAGL